MLMVGYHFAPGWQILTLPVFVLLTFGLSCGTGLLFSALNVEYRDFRYIVPFIVQFGLFVSPIAFDSRNVPSAWKLLYSLNPMVGIIDGFRWAITGANEPFDFETLCSSLLVMVLSVILGLWYFRRTERSFADVI
jgi:lipopolysaccharide transport system permease protein